ncbi:argininosuccinate lyase, partial [Paenibacillus larvae]|nr:argininosuccinate lyase [Paenibacillus larvae]
YGHLISLLTVLKALPLAYNKDMQEDKEGMFDTVRTLEGALKLFAPMVATMIVNEKRMRQAVEQDFSNATDIADYLVGKGVPFRQAHEIIGRTVLYCIQNGKYLLDLELNEFKQFSEWFDESIYTILQPEQVVNARDVYGGTAQVQVMNAISRAEKKLVETRNWVEQHRQV